MLYVNNKILIRNSRSKFKPFGNFTHTGILLFYIIIFIVRTNFNRKFKNNLLGFVLIK
jgi:hypothetical protein